MSSKKINPILLAIILLGGSLRFYNLMWGDGFFFHPDENNMAAAITRLNCKPILSSILNCNLNPHFFAYGQLPLYLAYFSHVVVQLAGQLFQLRTLNLELPMASLRDAIFWLRFWSAFFSTLTILVVFLISKKLLTFNFALLTATLVAATPGLIQTAHFGTTESLLTFLFLLIVYVAIKLAQSNKPPRHKLKYVFLLGVLVGVSSGVKLAGLYFAAPAIITIFLGFKKQIKWLLTSAMLALFAVATSYLLTSPYNLLAKDEFLGSMRYETAVVKGSVKVFYTRQFENTYPLLFQIEKIFPYALGWPIFVLGSLGFLLINFRLITYLILFIVQKVQNSKFKVQNENSKLKISKTFNFTLQLLILNFALLTYLFPNSFLFAKWTRFMTPILPFFSIFAAYLWCQASHQKTPQGGVIGDSEMIQNEWDSHPNSFITQRAQFVKRKVERTGIEPVESRVRIPTLNQSRPTIIIITILLISLSIIPALSFFSIYLKPDVRVQASKWIYQNIPDGSYILSETANVVDIPIISSKFKVQSSKMSNMRIPTYSVISFNFYELDADPKLINELAEHLQKADYILVPSRRIFANHLRFPDKYPKVNRYYSALFEGKLGFELIAICKEPRRGKEIFAASGCLTNPASWRDEKFMSKKIFATEYSGSALIADETAEETWSVFDHPVVRIFKKVKPHDIVYYQQIL